MNTTLMTAFASALLATATVALTPTPALAQHHERYERHRDHDGRYDRDGRWDRDGWRRGDRERWERRDRRHWGRYDRRWGYERRWRYRGRDCAYMGYGPECRSYGDDGPYIILRLFNDLICYTRPHRARVVCPRDWYDY